MNTKTLWCNDVYVAELIVADSFWRKMRGLLGLRTFDDVMCFPKTRQVHTYFMHFAIDVVHCDVDGNVIFKEVLQPNTQGKRVKNSDSLYETYRGGFMSVQVGDRFEVRERVYA